MRSPIRQAAIICCALGMVSVLMPEAHAQAEAGLHKNVAYYSKEECEKDAYIEKRCRLDLYVPVDAKDFATVVWFHGGGLKGGQKAIPKELRDQGIAVVAANYRLYPKAKCPSYLEDAAAAVAWTFENIAKHGGDPKKVFVAGHSAGGYLATMLVLDKSYLAKHEIDADKIAGLFSYSGQCLTHFTIREERGVPLEQGMADRFAPIRHVRAKTPPIVLYTGQRDLEMAARYEENALLFSMLKAAGHKDVQLHELKGGNHTSMVKPAHKLTLNRLEEMLKKP